MKNITRIAITAAAFSALSAIACSSSPSDTDTAPSVGVEQGTVDPTCVKGGTTCGLPGGSSGLASSSGYVSSSSGFTLDPGTSGAPPPEPLRPPFGADPISCGERCTPTVDRKGYPACDCGGAAGNGLQSNVVCGVTTPCRYYVWGAYRCYQVDTYSGACH